MPDMTIKVSGGETKFADGTSVKLVADAGDKKPTKHQWILNEAPIAGATNADYTFPMGVATDGEYRVTAELDGKPIESDRVSLTRTGDEEPSIFYPQFAMISGAVALVLGVGALIAVLWLVGSVLADSSWAALEGRLKIAVVLGLPATIVGSVLIMFGLWMATVEWRGKLKDPVKAPKGKTGDEEGVNADAIPAATVEAIKGVITAVGNLKGAALAIVVGGLLMMGTVWVAQSAASAPGPAATDAPTSTDAPATDAPATPPPT